MLDTDLLDVEKMRRSVTPNVLPGVFLSVQKANEVELTTVEHVISLALFKRFPDLH